MGDIKATFLANFDQMVASSKAAEAALKAVESGGNTAQVALNEISASSERAGGRFNELRGTLGKFDGALSAMGVNVGSEIRGLGELGDIAGKTAGQMGLIATGGFVVAAAMAGVKVGRWAAEWLGTDAAIGAATAKLLGWGDVAGEVAGAAADLHARIMAAGTGFSTWKSNADVSALAVKHWHDELATVTASGDLASLTKDLESQNFPLKELAERYHVSVEALQFFGRETKAAAAAEKEAADSIHASNERQIKDLQAQLTATQSFRDAMEELNSSGTGWKGTLDTIDGSVVEAIKSYLAAGVSQKALAEAYGLTDTQVRSVTSALRDDKTASDDLTKAHQLLAEAQKFAAKEADGHTAALEKQRQAAEKAAIEIAKLQAANRAMGSSTQYDLSTEAGRAKVPEGIATWLHDGYSLAQAAQIDFLMRWGLPINANDPLFRTKGPRVPGFAGGVENFAGGLAMVGERGPELVTLPRGSSVSPHGAGGRGGVTVNINVNGVFDPATSHQLADVVGREMMRSMKRSQKLGL